MEPAIMSMMASGLSGLKLRAAFSTIGVLIIPGQMALTVMLSLTTSRASALVKPQSAAFVVA
jgi:hypothetical protein